MWVEEVEPRLLLAADVLTDITSSDNPSTYGESVTFTATVTSGSTPTAGSVEFFVGTTSLGTDSEIDSFDATTATFSISTSTLNAGTYSLI